MPFAQRVSSLLGGYKRAKQASNDDDEEDEKEQEKEWELVISIKSQDAYYDGELATITFIQEVTSLYEDYLS